MRLKLLQKNNSKKCQEQWAIQLVINLQMENHGCWKTHQMNHLNLEPKNWAEVIDDWSREYNRNSQIEFKTSILKSSLCDYSDAYVLVNETIKNTGAGTYDAAKQFDERNKEVIFKNCAPISDCMSKINNT